MVMFMIQSVLRIVVIRAGSQPDHRQIAARDHLLARRWQVFAGKAVAHDASHGVSQQKTRWQNQREIRCNLLQYCGARERTRTFTPVKALEPESSGLVNTDSNGILWDATIDRYSNDLRCQH